MHEDTRVRVTRGDHAGRVGTVRSASTTSVWWVHFDDDPPDRQWKIAHDDFEVLPVVGTLREVLAALVADEDAGLDDGGFCVYCAAEAPAVISEEIHEPDCPIRRGRELLATTARTTTGGEG
jgi:hypothetical protein